MTIDERVESLLMVLPLRPHNSYNAAKCNETLRDALEEVARDQRNACADALTFVPAKPDVGYVDWHEAHQAVMNAKIK